MLKVAVNTRCLAGPATGVQRYTRSILAALGERTGTDGGAGGRPDVLADSTAAAGGLRTEPIGPRRLASGALGHAWEQCVLPLRLGGRLLWSPGNTGPLSVPGQVLTLHDLSPLDHPEWTTRRFGGWYRRLLPRLLRRVRAIIVPSAFTRSRVEAWVPEAVDRVSVIPEGAADCFAPQPPEGVAAARKAVGLGPGPYALAVGSIEPRKNLPVLLGAWSRLRDRLGYDAQLAIVGQAGARRIFRAAGLAPADAPPGVRFLGRVDDAHLPGLYAGARLLAQPSAYEGFGLPVLEAMACGTPAVVVSGSACHEVAGPAGLAVDAGDADALAEAVGALWTDPVRRDELAADALGRARGFTWARAAEATAAVLTAAANG